MPGQAPKIRSYYGPSGWSAAKKRVLDAVVLPEKSRCFECGKSKTTVIAFSEKQQNDLRNGIASGQVKPKDTAKGWITCRTCVGVQKHEMLCVDCDMVKGLDGFAKTQRRDPDNARCMKCVAGIANLTPVETNPAGAEDDDSEMSSDSDDTQSNIYGSSINDTDDLESNHGVRLPAPEMAENQKLNFSREPSTQASTGILSTTASVASTNGASNAGVTGWQTMSRNNGNNAAHYRAYDAQGNAHVKAVSSTASTTSDDSDVTTTHASRPVREKPGSKFAKIPAYQRAPVVVPDYDPGRNVNYDSGSDDDDDDDFFTI